MLTTDRRKPRRVSQNPAGLAKITTHKRARRVYNRRMSKYANTPHIRLAPEDISPYVLTVGDPARAQRIAEFLTNAQPVGAWREYHTYTGEYKNLRVTAISHGVGGAGAAICFHELFGIGAHTIIRVGTCGSYVSEMRAGSLLIGTGASREDGTSNVLAPIEYPAVSDLDVTLALRNAAQRRGDVKFKLGVVRSDAAFYHELMPNPHQLWADVGAVGIEMELATLLIIASIHRVRAGGIFVVDGNPNESAGDMSDYNPHRDEVERAKDASIEIALDALHTLANS